MPTSYANAGGTGDRRASITATTTAGVSGTWTNILNGDTGENNFWLTGSAAPQSMKFDFGAGAKKIIDTFKWYQSNISSHGTWQWWGSNDDTSYTALGASFTLAGPGGGGGLEITEPAGNTTGYRYYKMISSAGSTSNSPFIREIEFKIDDAPTQVVAAQTMAAFANSAAVVVIDKAAAAQTMLAFTQSCVAITPAQAAAAQTMGAFSQAATISAINKAVSSQTINAFGVTQRPVPNFIHAADGAVVSGGRMGSMKAGARPRRAL